ncbi:hypothetical protein [Ligilactobacillus ruminis]|uniref:hypothetical protein n=1 Tax=Ligilactobacillus ruminis TaxID=1623 RepID=UPI0022E216B7|nr:hypothetical protein [Ligilactobacillus ruminis]
MTKWRIELLADDPLMIYDDISDNYDGVEVLYLHSNDQKAFENAALIPFDEIKLISGRTIERRGYVNAKRIDCVQETEDE